MNYFKKIALAAGALGAMALPAYAQSSGLDNLPTRMTLEDKVPEKKQEEKVEKQEYKPYESASPALEFRGRASAGISDRENSKTSSLVGLGNITLDFGNTDLNATYRGEKQHQKLTDSTIDEILHYDNKAWASVTHHTKGPVYLLFGAGAGISKEEYQIVPVDSNLDDIVYGKQGPFGLALAGITNGKPNGEVMYWFDNKSNFLIVQGVASSENASGDAEGSAYERLITANSQLNFGDISAVVRGSRGSKKIGDMHKEKIWKLEAGPRLHLDNAFIELVGTATNSDLIFQGQESDAEKYGATIRGGIRLFGDFYLMPVGGVRKISGKDDTEFYGGLGILGQF